jgi:hypothetical protein
MMASTAAAQKQGREEFTADRGDGSSPVARGAQRPEVRGSARARPVSEIQPNGDPHPVMLWGSSAE